MTIPASVLVRMATIGLSVEQAEAVAAMLSAVETATRDEGSAALEARRSADRERKARQRHGKSRDITGQDVTSVDNPSPKKETSPTPPKEKTTPSSSEDKSSSITPRSALESVLDAERAGAVIDHRKRIGKPLTAHAAKLLADKLARCADPNFAADEMISNGWQGFKPEWLERRSSSPRQSTDPPRPPRNAGELSYQQLMGQTDEHSNQNDRRLGSGDGDAETPNLGGFQKFAVSGEFLRRM